ncbi:MAG: hypothetical protein ACLFUI_04340 [Halanaerobiales bacterium]
MGLVESVHELSSFPGTKPGIIDHFKIVDLMLPQISGHSRKDLRTAYWTEIEIILDDEQLEGVKSIIEERKEVVDKDGNGL